jgi:hypothetical protein
MTLMSTRAMTDETQDLLLYIDRTESHLLQENARLSQSLHDANLDLEDARRSRRELQQQLNVVSQRMGQLGMDNEGLKVEQLNDILWSRLISLEPQSICHGFDRWR